MSKETQPIWQPSSQYGALAEPQEQDAPDAEDTGQLPEEEPDDLIGQEIDKWTLTRRLGRGGMAVVYEANHTWLQQRAAIKLLLPDAYHNPKALDRFRQEAQTVSRLAHPNIVEIKDFGEDPDHSYYMVMELLQGQDLAQWHKSNHTPQSDAWLLSLFTQLCEALHAIHKAQIVHRDLKPSNLFLEPGQPFPHAKLLDFGVAKILEQEDYGSMTTTGVILGTPFYLAPEQLKTKQVLSPATDIYAAGVMLYELVTGQLPLKGEGPIEHMLLVAQEPPPLAGKRRPALAGTALEALLAQMLDKQPAMRPATARAALEALQQALNALPPQLKEQVVVPSSAGVTTARQPENHPSPAPPIEKKPQQEVSDRTRPLHQSDDLPASLLPPQPSESAPTYTSRIYLSLRQHMLLWLGLGLVGLSAGAGLWVWHSTQPIPSVTPSPQRPIPAPNQPSRPPTNALSARMTAANAAFLQGQLEAAIKHWEAAIAQPSWSQDPSYPKLYQRLALAYAKRQRWSIALAYLQRYRKASPSTTLSPDVERARALWRRHVQSQEKEARKQLESLRTQCREKSWLLCYVTYQKIRQGAHDHPRILEALRQLLKADFPAIGFSLTQQILGLPGLTDKQRAYHQAQMAEQAQWRQRDLAQMRQQLKPRKTQAAATPQGLQRSWKGPPPLRYYHRHALWRQTLRSLPHDRTKMAYWRWHIQQLSQLHREHLWPWLQAQYKQMPPALDLKRQQAALRHYQQELRLQTALQEATKHGALSKAEAICQRLQQLAGSDDLAARHITPLTLTWARWCKEMTSAQALLTASRKLAAKGYVDKANQRRDTLLDLLRDHPAHDALQALLAQHRKQDARRQRLRRKADKAYQNKEWSKARLAYKAYLKQLPYASDAANIKRRQKACRCAISLFPWEICQPKDFPSHFRRK